MKDFSKFYHSKTNSRKDYFSLRRYLELVLNHMIPKNNNIIFNISEEEK